MKRNMRGVRIEKLRRANIDRRTHNVKRCPYCIANKQHAAKRQAPLGESE